MSFRLSPPNFELLQHSSKKPKKNCVGEFLVSELGIIVEK